MSGPGNDPYNVKGGWYGGGLDWNPCLIMFNNDLTYWAGGINSPGGYNMSNPGTGTGIGMTNAWFFQGDGGIRRFPSWISGEQFLCDGRHSTEWLCQ